MKFLRSINESVGKKYWVLWWANEELSVDILGIFENEKDLDIYILNYVNSEVEEMYAMGETDFDNIGDYTEEKDGRGHYIFIDADKALDWICERGHNHIQCTWDLSFSQRGIDKPVLNKDIQDYIDAKKYNL